MEEHVQEELVVVETDAIGDPWAVMVHLEDAPVALRAMVTPVWLRLVAPLADTNATIALALDRRLHAHHTRLFRARLGARTRLLLWVGAVTVEGASRGVQIFEVLVDHLLGLACLFFYQLVSKLFTAASLTFCLLLLLLHLEAALRSRRLHHGDGLFATRRISAHVPLLVFGDVTRIGRNSPNNRHNEHGGGKGEDACEEHGLFALIFHDLLVLCPALLE